MRSEPLSLIHQETLEKKFRELNLPLSEYSFANLYLFRTLHQFEVIYFHNELFIKGITRDHVPYAMLTSHPSHYSLEILSSLFSQIDILFPIPESWLNFFEKHLIQASFKDEESDYLFTSKKLATFPGRHLSKKRNLVKQLQTHHHLEVIDFSDQIEHAIEILDNWQEDHATNLIDTDYKACKEAVENFSLLHLHGRIVYVDDKPAGFTIGERISTDCYVLHFCKGEKSIKGLYQFLYQDLARIVEKEWEWINLEQDLGIPSIRAAKQSYLPDRYALKWRVYLK